MLSTFHDDSMVGKSRRSRTAARVLRPLKNCVLLKIIISVYTHQQMLLGVNTKMYLMMLFIINLKTNIHTMVLVPGLTSRSCYEVQR